ncbi:MAG: MerR family transcriptional regulator [Bacteriovoracia bacterium]
MKYFNIQMAAQISGLSTHTIRAWEKRYGALRPDRTETGRRQYSTEEIERLTLLSQLTNLGNSIGQIARLPDGELKEIYQNSPTLVSRPF